MTRDEAKKLLLIMESTYPNFKVKDSFMVDAWHIQLEHDDYETMQSALIAYNRTNTSGFAPSIGQLVDLAYNIQNPEMNEMEAWGIIRHLLKSSIYYSKENWEGLPTTLKKCISAEQLRTWAMDEEFNENVAQSNFCKTYRVELERKKERAMIPAEIRKQIELAGNKLFLES